MIYKEVIEMPKVISKCPCCGGALRIATLQCSNCNMELRNNFEVSVFDTLSAEEYSFLMTFLQQRGNLKNVQRILNISYPTAKKKMDELLVHLGLVAEEREEKKIAMPDITNLTADRNSTKVSEIIKAKLLENGGRVIVHTARGLPCEITAASDGKSFISNKLPIKPPYEYRVFDAIVDLLLANGGRARKGNGRNYKLGQPECDESTVVGAVALYAGKKLGESVYDPTFVLAAVLEWAGIANNERGELVLTQAYRGLL